MDPRQTTPPRGPENGAPPNGGGGSDGWDGADFDWREEFRHQQSQSQRPGLPDLSPVFALLDSLRRMVPPELQDQFNALQREVLLTVRALIDWYLERLDARSRPVQVEEIPID
jgi:hypothetical protein